MITLKIDQTVKTIEEVSITHSPYPERMRRAIRICSVFFVLFIISIFIPVLHFFLSPLFLGLAFWQFFVKLNEKYELNFSQIQCPRCNQNPHLRKEHAKIKLFKDYCPTCRYTLIITE